MAQDDKQPILIALGVIGFIVLVVLGYLFLTDREPEETVRQTIEVPAPQPIEVETTIPESDPVIDLQEPIPIPVKPTEPSFILPDLSASDPLVRDGVPALVTHPDIGNLLTSDELIRKFVVLTDNVARGKVPRQHVDFLAPDGEFKATKLDEDTYLLDEKSYRRFDHLADVVSSFNSRRTVEFYILVRPLLQEAFQELGYGDEPFDEEVLIAMEHLLEAPIITYPIRLNRPVVMYKFEDLKLESLSDTQKQLIRMGPRNTSLIQAKLTELIRELREVVEP